MPQTTTDQPRDLPGEHEVDHKTLAQRRGAFRRLNGMDKYPTPGARMLAQHMRDLGVFVSKSLRKKRARL